MARDDKATAVAELAAQLRDSDATVLTEYRGLTVAQLRELRRTLGSDNRYTVAKNTLARRAAAEAGVEGLGEFIGGPSAWAFIRGDVVEAAKGLRDFAKTNKALVIKGGLMDGAILRAVDIERLADLESREVLLAKMAGALQASLAGAAALFAAPAAQAARTVEALRVKLAAESAAGEAAGEATESAD